MGSNERCLWHVIFHYNNNPAERLALTGLDFCGFTGFVRQRYRFKYHELNRLPKYLSKQTDHWGYYNGVDDKMDEFNTRNTDAEKVLFGSLKEITYPTGGKTIFEFEPHSYTKILWQRKAVDLYNCPITDK